MTAAVAIVFAETRYRLTFKRTRSLFNAVSFKHDNNVCACALSALILLPVVNLPLEMDSATSISYMTWRWKVSPFDAAFRLIMAIFHCACTVSTTLLLPV